MRQLVHRFGKRVGVAVCGLLLALPLAQQARAAEKGTYQQPSVTGFELIWSRDFDLTSNQDGVPETRVVMLKSPEGKYITRYSTDNRVWAISVLEDLDNRGNLQKNYCIRDSDGDGVFDEKYSVDDNFTLPRVFEPGRARVQQAMEN